MEAQKVVARLQEQLRDGSLPADEPVFVLQGRHILAAKVVRTWADELESLVGTNTQSRDARAVASQLAAWPIKRIPGRDDSGRAA